MNNDKKMATWSISLDTTCPQCEEDFDLTRHRDYWLYEHLEALETHTEASKDVEVTCPKCDAEFLVDLEQ